MTPPVVVYGLTTAADGYRVRYVGQTREPDRRLAEHLRRSGGRRREPAVKRWVRERRAEGHDVLFLIIWTGGDPGDAERFWVAALRALGADLLNATAGGDGGKLNWAHGRKRS